MIFPLRPPLDLAFFARRDGGRHCPGVLCARSPRRFQQMQGRAPVPFAGLGGSTGGSQKPGKPWENHGKTIGKWWFNGGFSRDFMGFYGIDVFGLWFREYQYGLTYLMWYQLANPL